MADGRSERFQIKLTTAEREQLFALAERYGVSAADVLRSLVRQASGAEPLALSYRSDAKL